MANLMEGLLEEIDRNNILLEAYKSIGTPGTFGAAGITTDLKTAKEAIGSGDVVAMVRAYRTLQGNQ